MITPPIVAAVPPQPGATLPARVRQLLTSRLQWPRGKYNGRRISGADVKLTWRIDFFSWKPECRWNWGQPYFMILGFRAQAEATYHFDDV